MTLKPSSHAEAAPAARTPVQLLSYIALPFKELFQAKLHETVAQSRARLEGRRREDA